MRKKQAVEPIVESLAIAVPVERAWEALTSPRVLGDLVLGHVEIEARPGRPFLWRWDVWAKAAPRSAGGGDFTWRGTVLDAVPGSTLVLGGDGITMVFTTKGEGNASLVTAVQASFPPGANREGFQHGWADFLLRLKTCLERPPASDSVYVRTLVRASPAEIIRAWLSPAAMGKILPGKVRVEARPGGRFEWQCSEAGVSGETRKRPKGLRTAKRRTDMAGVASGRFIEIDKGRQVAFIWEATMPPSEIRVAAQPTPYGALVSLEQIGSLGVGMKPEVHRRMWARLLERLRAYFYYQKKIRPGG